MWIAARTNTSIAIEKFMPELSDVLIDVWSQVLVHDSQCREARVGNLSSHQVGIFRVARK
jgi:hypothetical protein